MIRTVLALGLFSLVASRLSFAEEGAAGKPSGPAQATSAAPSAKKIDWEKMSFDERRKYMKTTVLPEMKKLFVAFDSKRFAKMKCETCHGTKGPDAKFKMPNADLPKLPQPTDRAGFMALQQKKPEAVKFMGTQVKPKMAELLGLSEGSPSNPTGFGCYTCHTKEGGGGAPAAPAGAAPGGKESGAPKPPAGW